MEATGLQAEMAAVARRAMEQAKRIASRRTIERPALMPCQLPAALQGFPPALHWHPSTVAIWAEANALRASAIGLHDLEVYADDWVELVIDLLRSQGATPWNDPTAGYVTFAGCRVRPRDQDLRLLVRERGQLADDGCPYAE